MIDNIESSFLFLIFTTHRQQQILFIASYWSLTGCRQMILYTISIDFDLFSAELADKPAATCLRSLPTPGRFACLMMPHTARRRLRLPSRAFTPPAQPR
jgi:hypothetical protein